MFDIGHEDDYVIELANEVRKVLGTVGIGMPKEKKLLGPSSYIPLKPLSSPIKVRPLPEGVVMDSWGEEIIKETERKKKEEKTTFNLI